MMSDREQIEATLQAYLDGLYEADAKKISQVFHECCHLFSVNDGKLGDQTRDAWLERVRQRAPGKESGLERKDWIVTIDQSSPATAFAKVQCQLPPRYFTDYLTLVKLESGWRIVSKTFHTDTRL